MTTRSVLIGILLLFSINIWAQDDDEQTIQTIVVKFNGDTICCDVASLTMRNQLVCKTKGKETIKLDGDDVSYYIEPYTIMVRSKGEFTSHAMDTTRKCIPDGGMVYVVEMENDSFYLASQEYDRNHDLANPDMVKNYYIYNKTDNTQEEEVPKTISAIDLLKDYFGGSCPVFDQLLQQSRGKFILGFDYPAWNLLIRTYNLNCKK